MRVSLCLLVWDELQGCKIDVPRLPRDIFDEIYAIDSGSKDGTVDYLESQGIPVYQQPNKGLNAAYTHAVEKSTCDAVVVFFPKGTIPTSDLHKFRPLLEAGNDLVVASRNIKGGRNEEDHRILKPRKWAVLLLATFAALIWKREGHFVHDVLHGVKGFSVSGFRKMDVVGQGLSIDIEMVIRAYRLRLKRTEFPTAESARLAGESQFKFFPTGRKLAKYLLWELRRKV